MSGQWSLLFTSERESKTLSTSGILDVTPSWTGSPTMRITLLGWRIIPSAIFKVQVWFWRRHRLFYNNIYRWVNLEPSYWRGSMTSFSWTTPRSSKPDQVRDGEEYSFFFRNAWKEEKDQSHGFDKKSKQPLLVEDAWELRDLTICPLNPSNHPCRTQDLLVCINVKELDSDHYCVLSRCGLLPDHGLHLW